MSKDPRKVKRTKISGHAQDQGGADHHEHWDQLQLGHQEEAPLGQEGEQDYQVSQRRNLELTTSVR